MIATGAAIVIDMAGITSGRSIAIPKIPKLGVSTRCIRGDGRSETDRERVAACGGREAHAYGWCCKNSNGCGRSFWSGGAGDGKCDGISTRRRVGSRRVLEHRSGSSIAKIPGIARDGTRTSAGKIHDLRRATLARRHRKRSGYLGI